MFLVDPDFFSYFKMESVIASPLISASHSVMSCPICLFIPFLAFFSTCFETNLYCWCCQGWTYLCKCLIMIWSGQMDLYKHFHKPLVFHLFMATQCPGLFCHTWIRIPQVVLANILLCSSLVTEDHQLQILGKGFTASCSIKHSASTLGGQFHQLVAHLAMPHLGVIWSDFLTYFCIIWC